MNLKITLLVSFLLLNYFDVQVLSQNNKATKGTGHLFIIGGGDRTESLMKDLITVSDVNANDYVIVLPMSSEEPDTSVKYIKEDFAKVGITNVIGFNFLENGAVDQSKLDSISKAKLIFITGGDQSKFMKVVKKGSIYAAIHKAYESGSTIGGTSAGAAVMSKKMITGNKLLNPKDNGGYPSIEANNIEITEGLGLLENAIVDQHFIKRQRLNRLLAVSIENPDELCIGIDESTAIVVSGNKFRVSGENQVIVLRNQKKDKKIKSTLLGAKGIVLDVLLPDEIYKM